MKLFATLAAIGSMILTPATALDAQQADPRFGDGGTSSFYTWARPVPAPGMLLRQEPLPAQLVLPEAGQGIRILYSSTDGIDGRERVAVSGAYFTPKGKPPEGGWPLIVWAHGTVGLADVCAPSWAGRSDRDIRYLNSWLEQGFAVVATDYQGLGTPGPHAYMVTRPQAYSMLDSARAAVRSQRNLSGKVILLGQSQGATAAFAAAGFAAGYAPDLDIRGAVSTGTPYVAINDPQATSLPGDPSRIDPTIAYTYYLTLTVQQTRPEITAAEIYTERAAPLIEQARTMCIKPLKAAVVAAGLTRANAMRQDIDRARIYGPLLPSLLYSTLHLPVPIFMAIGAADRDVSPAGQLRLAREACDAGTVVEAHLYEGLDHSATVNASLKDSLPFVRRVLAGQPIAPRCVPAEEAPTVPTKG